MEQPPTRLSRLDTEKKKQRKRNQNENKVGLGTCSLEDGISGQQGRFVRVFNSRTRRELFADFSSDLELGECRRTLLPSKNPVFWSDAMHGKVR